MYALNLGDPLSQNQSSDTWCPLKALEGWRQRFGDHKGDLGAHSSFREAEDKGHLMICNNF